MNGSEKQLHADVSNMMFAAYNNVRDVIRVVVVGTVVGTTSAFAALFLTTIRQVQDSILTCMQGHVRRRYAQDSAHKYVWQAKTLS